MATEGEFVGSGSFQVDRRVALEKLRDFRLAKPGAFLRPLLRCAVASGATRFDVKKGSHSIEARFDGRALDRAFFDDPYAALLSTGEPGGVNAANALLAALRFHPKSLEITSGAGSDRMTLKAASLGEEESTPEPSEETDTVLRIRWSWYRMMSPLEAISQLEFDPVMLAGRLSLDPGRDTSRGESNASFHRLYPFTPSVDQKSGGIRVRVSAPSLHSNYGDKGHDGISWLHLYQLGVPAEDVVEQVFPEASVIADVNDDGFRLDASLDSVVRDERFEAAMREVSSAISRLIESTAAAHADYPRRSAFLFQPGAEGAVAFVRGRSHPETTPDGHPVASPWMDCEEAVAYWLRDTAVRAFAQGVSDDLPSHLRALWEAPLYLTTAGRGLSLDEIARLIKRNGAIRVSSQPGGTAGEPVMFSPRLDGLYIERIFPGKIAQA